MPVKITADMPTYSRRQGAARFQLPAETPVHCRAEVPPITGATDSPDSSIPTLLGCDLSGLVRNTFISTP